MANPGGMLTLSCCGQCCQIGNCLGFNWDSPPTGNPIGVRFYNLPDYIPDIVNGVEYTVPMTGFGQFDDFKACVFGFELTVGFSGNVLRVTFWTRDNADEGGPCMDVSVSFPGVLLASGTCASIGDQMCSGLSPCPGGTGFNIGSLCQCDPKVIGDDYHYPKFTRAVISTCPGGEGANVSYNCVDGSCIDPMDGTGTYATLADCHADDCPGPTPSCADLTDCVDAGPAFVKITLFEDCTVTTHERLWSNLNGNYTFDQSEEMDAALFTPACPTQAAGHYLVVLGDYISADTGGGEYLNRRADPGVPWRNDTTFESFRDEYFACALGIETSCTDGFVTITAFHIIWQFWRMLWDGVGYNTIQLYGGPTCDSYTSETVIDSAPAGICSTSGEFMCSEFDYQKCDGGGIGQQFKVCGLIGPIAVPGP